MNIDNTHLMKLPHLSNNKYKLNNKIALHINPKHYNRNNRPHIQSLSTNKANCFNITQYRSSSTNHKSLKDNCSISAQRNPMLNTFSLLPSNQSKPSHTSTSLTSRRQSNSHMSNSLFLTFLSNRNKLKLNKTNMTTTNTLKQSNVNSFQFNTINQTDITRLESIDESVQVSYRHFITHINQSNMQSRLLNTKYTEFVSDEEERINNQIIELKPELHQSVFAKDNNHNTKTDFAKVIEHLISLKKKITPKLIKEILKKSEAKREIEKRKMILINQKKGNDSIMKMLNYRLNVGKKYKKKQ